MAARYTLYVEPTNTAHAFISVFNTVGEAARYLADCQDVVQFLLTKEENGLTTEVSQATIASVLRHPSRQAA